MVPWQRMTIGNYWQAARIFLTRGRKRLRARNRLAGSGAATSAGKRPRVACEGTGESHPLGAPARSPRGHAGAEADLDRPVISRVRGAAVEPLPFLRALLGLNTLWLRGLCELPSGPPACALGPAPTLRHQPGSLPLPRVGVGAQGSSANAVPEHPSPVGSGGRSPCPSREDLTKAGPGQTGTAGARRARVN